MPINGKRPHFGKSSWINQSKLDNRYSIFCSRADCSLLLICWRFQRKTVWFWNKNGNKLIRLAFKANVADWLPCSDQWFQFWRECVVKTDVTFFKARVKGRGRLFVFCLWTSSSCIWKVLSWLAKFEVLPTGAPPPPYQTPYTSFPLPVLHHLPSLLNCLLSLPSCLLSV